MRDGKLYDLQRLANHIPYARICDEWNSVRMGTVPNGYRFADLGDGYHGVTHIRNGKVTGIQIHAKDPQRRQLVTVVHEALHKYAHPYRPNHDQIHSLAMVAANHIFRKYADSEDNEEIMNHSVFDADEMELVGRLGDQRIALTDDYDDDNGELSTLDLFRKKKGRSRPTVQTVPGAQVQVAAGMMAPQQRVAPPGQISEILGTAAGWATTHILAAYTAGAFVAPLSGITRMKPVHNVAGLRAADVKSFWDQLLQTLTAGTTRGAFSSDAETAVAGVATVVAIAAARSVGVVMHLSSPVNNTDGRPVRVRHFTGAGQTELEYYVIRAPGCTDASWLIIHPENDRGSGVPAADDDFQVTINADGVLAGTIVGVESLNLRDIQR